MFKRKPDVIIGPPDNPYMERWHIIPRNRWFNIYLHKISRSDDDRALHDHRADNLSIILKGSYTEYLASASKETYNWGISYIKKYDCLNPIIKKRSIGNIVFRKAEHPHRLELSRDQSIDWPISISLKLAPRRPVWTLWLKFGDRRDWGFYPDNKFIQWEEYLQKYGAHDQVSNYKE